MRRGVCACLSQLPSLSGRASRLPSSGVTAEGLFKQFLASRLSVSPSRHHCASRKRPAETSRILLHLLEHDGQGCLLKPKRKTALACEHGCCKPARAKGIVTRMGRDSSLGRLGERQRVEPGPRVRADSPTVNWRMGFPGGTRNKFADGSILGCRGGSRCPAFSRHQKE